MRNGISQVRRLAIFAVLMTAPMVANAGEIPQAVKNACSADYKKLCMKHEPGSNAGRDCMADAFDRLSDPCVNAILNSDLVGEDPVAAQPDRKLAGNAKPALKAGKSTKSRKVRTAKRTRGQRANNKRRYTSQASSGWRSGRVSRKIKRGLRKADRAVARAFSRVFR